MTDKQLLKQALEALENSIDDVRDCLNEHLPHAGYARCDRRIEAYKEQIAKHEEAITAIRARLEQPEQEPVAWQERQARRMNQGVVTEWTNWYPCRHRTIDEARKEAPDHIPYEWRPLYTTPPAGENK